MDNNFLKNLQDALKSGDASKGKDIIDRINDIEKMADHKANSKEREAEEIRNKYADQLDEHYNVEPLTKEEQEKENKRIEEFLESQKFDEKRLKWEAEIDNAELEVEKLLEEKKDVMSQYDQIISKQRELVEEYKNKLNELDESAETESDETEKGVEDGE